MYMVTFFGPLTYTSTRANQNRSLLLKLPTELRILVYEFVFKCSSVCVVPWRRRGLSTRSVHSGKYRGAFSLLYTCRQIHHEAFSLPKALVTYDFTSLIYIDSATKLLGPNGSESVLSIKISAREVNKITDWVVGGARNTNGDGHHYAMGLFPALMCVEIRDRKRRLESDIHTIQHALRHCFKRETLKVCVCYA
jgi:hypothetical protein